MRKSFQEIVDRHVKMAENTHPTQTKKGEVKKVDDENLHEALVDYFFSREILLGDGHTNEAVMRKRAEQKASEQKINTDDLKLYEISEMFGAPPGTSMNTKDVRDRAVVAMMLDLKAMAEGSNKLPTLLEINASSKKRLEVAESFKKW